MKKNNPKITIQKKLALTNIKDTPFTHATDGQRNYIICGKVILEKEELTNKEQISEWLEKKPWEAIAMLCQSIYNEFINEDKK